MKRNAAAIGYFYEYMYAKAIEQTNWGLSGPNRIDGNQALKLRRKLDETLGFDLHTEANKNQEIKTAIDQVLGEYVGQSYKPLFANSDFYLKTTRDFGRILGNEWASFPDKQPIGDHYVPITGYDPRFSHREFARYLRTKDGIGYTPTAELITANNGDAGALAKTDGAVEVFPVFASHNVTTANYEKQKIGYVCGATDASGISRLRDYMSAEEYEGLKEYASTSKWYNQEAWGSPEKQYTSRAGVDRAVAILQTLRQNGVRYSVEKDHNPGQIKAVLPEQKAEIRLLDAKDPQYAGGRIYRDGVTTRFAKQGRSGSGTEIENVKDEQTNKALAKLLLYKSLGIGDGSVEGYTANSAVYIPSDNAQSSTYVPQNGGEAITIRREADNNQPQFFVDRQKAAKWGKTAVETARQNFVNELNTPALIEHYRSELERVTDGSEELVEPIFSQDETIAGIQRDYWQILTGATTNLMRPGANAQLLQERIDTVGGIDEDESFGNLIYTGSAQEQIAEHSQEVADELIGNWESTPHLINGEIVDMRFDPIQVAKYMTSANSQWTNLDDLASACRRCDIDGLELMGEGFQNNMFRNSLIKYEATKRIDPQDYDPFIAEMVDHVKNELAENSLENIDVNIDENGVINWYATARGSNDKEIEKNGQLGQIFAPGHWGEIVTTYASGDDMCIIPGYRATIVPQDPNKPDMSVEERTKLIGYRQSMRQAISDQINADVLSMRTEIGQGDSLNRVYSGLYGQRHPVDFLASKTDYEISEEGDLVGYRITDDWTKTIVDTERRRVRYDNEIGEGSTTFAAWAQDNVPGVDPRDPNTVWGLTGGRNMSILTGKDARGVEAPEGYFDPMMTGTSRNQGIVRFLTQDAQVDEDGFVHPGDTSVESGRRAPLMLREELKHMAYDPFDRQNMTVSNLMRAERLDEPVNVALMTFGGWNADDGAVVSADYAKNHQIRGADGQLRNLVVGDKITDLHGNKSTISLIVDPDMSDEEAKAADLENEVTWARANRHVDVFMSPFSLISRRNAGTTHEMMSRERSDIYNPDGSVNTVNGVGKLRMVITPMAVDKKTRIYDDEDIRAGKGRKAGAQLAWALQSAGADKVLDEFYGSNTAGHAALTEYSRVLGIDLAQDGTLSIPPLDDVNKESNTQSQYKLFTYPELVYSQAKRRDKEVSILNRSAMIEEFAQNIALSGGEMEIPFPITLASGQTCPKSRDVLNPDGSTTSYWKLPVLSSSLRSGQTFEEGVTYRHAHSKQYLDIFNKGLTWLDANKRLREQGLSASDFEKYSNRLRDVQGEAQGIYNTMVGQIKAREFDGKNNLVKRRIMTNRLPNSATMVLTQDPRLNLGQIGLNKVAMEHIGVEEGDVALIWRDPILRDSGVRAMRVKHDPRLTGVAINPAAAKSFDGDFDGDQLAVVGLHTMGAKRQAAQLLSVENNLIDRGSVSVSVDGKQINNLSISTSLDTQVGLSKDQDAARQLAELRLDANGKTTPKAAYNGLNNLIKKTMRAEFGSAISFDDYDSHVNSIQKVCVDTGAKGNAKKLKEYTHNLAIDGSEGMTKAEQEASMYATSVKTNDTGLAGTISQRAVRMGRNLGNGKAIRSLLEATYLITSSILQIKHYAQEAKDKDKLLHGGLRNLWRGHLIDTESSDWRCVRDKNGDPVQANPRQWAEQALTLYRSKNGMNISDIAPRVIATVATVMTDPKTGLMRNLEDPKSYGGVTMDRIAYGDGLNELIKAAKNKFNLYEGIWNQHFAPKAVRVHQSENTFGPALESGEANIEEKRVDTRLLKKDTLAQHNVKPHSNERLSTGVNMGDFGASSHDDDYEMGL